MNIKKILILSVCTIVFILTAGCGKSENPAEITVSPDQKDIPVTESADESAADNPSDAESDYVDLTALSGTMVYAEVYNMMSHPEDYIGKTVRMDGVYAVYHDESTDKYYHACVISDATACCSQGIEFELKGDHSYPDDYPEEGSRICVEGVFDTYNEGDQMYCTLRDSAIQESTPPLTS